MTPNLKQRISLFKKCFRIFKKEFLGPIRTEGIALVPQREYTESGWSESLYPSFKHIITGYFARSVDALWKMPIVQDYTSLVLAGEVHLSQNLRSSLLSDLGTDQSKRFLLLNHILCLPIVQTVDTFGFEPTATQLSQAYKRFDATWLKAEQTRWIVIPLVNCTSPVSTLKLGSFSLEPFSQEDKTYIFNLLANGGVIFLSEFFPLPDISWSNTAAKLSVSFVHPADLNGGELSAKYEQALFDEARLLVTALRLLGPGLIAAPQKFSFVENVSISTSEDLDLKSSRNPSNYDINQVKSSQIRRLTKMLVNPNIYQEIKIPLERFNLSYSRQRPEERLIDLVIALDSILGRGLQGELTYRFSLRGAALLADEQDPGSTYSSLSTLYDVRSKVVHEGQSVDELTKKGAKGMNKISASGTQEVLEHWESLVRSIIVAIMTRVEQQLSAGKKVQLKDIMTDIDSEIIEALTRKKKRS